MKSYVYLNEHGQPEEIDLETGIVTKKNLSPTDLLDYHPVEFKGKMRWVKLEDSPYPTAYNPALGELFVYRILDGSGIKKACDEVKLPYPLYCKWRRLYPEFRDMVDEARKDRGEQFFDSITTTAEEAGTSEDELAHARLKIDAYKYAAKVSDPRRFGEKTQIDAKIGIGRIIVDTGVLRPGDPGFKEESIYEEIQGRQEEIKQIEIANTPAVFRKPEGLQLSEKEKDGLVAMPEDKNEKP